MTDAIERIRAAHLSARPKPAVNPAWANAEHDIGVLLAEIDRLRAEAGEEADPAQRFGRWLNQGPSLAVAAGLYVGIKVYASEQAAREVGDIA